MFIVQVARLHQRRQRQLPFTRNATKDDVTGAIMYTPWIATNGQNSFPAIISPTITGYTPSAPASTAVTVIGTSADNNQVITYYGDGETATVTYVDDTTGKILTTVHLTGKYDTTSGYRTQPTINQLEQAGYRLVSDNYPANGVQFTQNGQTQTFTVHLVEGTVTYTSNNNPENLPLAHQVTRTIHYNYSNGHAAANSVVQTITYTRTATKNLVTGQITYGPWQVVGIANMPAITSPLILGYYVSQTVISGWHGVTINDRSQTITVIYTPLHQGLHYGVAPVINSSNKAIVTSIRTPLTPNNNGQSQQLNNKIRQPLAKLTKKIPQTGDHRNTGLAILGLLSLVAALLLGSDLKDQRKK